MMSPSSYRSGITIDTQQAELVEDLLSELHAALPASLLLLADITGDVISVQGNDDRSLITPLASLIASDLVASREIARLAMQENTSPIVFREGHKLNSFVLESGENLVLYAQLDREIPLNWARVLLQQASQKLAEIVKNSSAKDITEHLYLNDDEINNAFDSLLME